MSPCPAPAGPRSGLRRYLATAFCARLAEEGMAVAVALLAVQCAGSAAQGAFVLTAWMAPHVVAAPLVGALATRMRHPRLGHLGALGGFAGSIVALSVLLGRAPTPLTLAVAAAGGCCGPVVSGGLSGLVAVLLPDGPPRDRAYALDAAVYNAASVAGPAVAGAGAALASPGAALLLLGGVAALAVALAAGLPYERPRGLADAAPATTLRADLAAGLTAVWRTRELRAITAAGCLAFIGIGGLTTTAVLLTAHRGHPGAGGALMTAFAVGALLGSLAVARWRPPLSDQRLAALSLCGTGLALGAAALIPAPAAGAALFVVAGGFDGPLLTATFRIRAGHARPDVRTQVFTLGAGLKITAASCGATLVGVAAALPPPLLLLAIAAAQLAAALLYMLTRPRPEGGGTRRGPALPDTAKGAGTRPAPFTGR
ncbi:MFS transporter [Streptomyces sp. NPDC056411]|uniref:MFS transporter n=1 Tax=Streptomyces sp. NPDC056411 TaxID=3345813 RepID=UPI0035DE6EEC